MIMKKIALISIVALLALVPLALAEEMTTPADPTATEVKAAATTVVKSVPATKARYTPDFKSMTRMIGTKITPAPKKTLTRENFKQLTTSITNCRKECTNEYRACLRTCSGKSNVCPKACKNANNKCYDGCAFATKR